MPSPANSLLVGLGLALGSGLARAAEENAVLSLLDLVVAAVISRVYIQI